MAIEIIIKNYKILFLCDWIIAFFQRYTNIYNLKQKIMYNKQVLCKKVQKQQHLLQFFIMYKNYTFCITNWLVNINSKLKSVKFYY